MGRSGTGSIKRVSRPEDLLEKVQKKASFMLIHEGDFMAEMVGDIQRNVDAVHAGLLARRVA